MVISQAVTNGGSSGVFWKLCFWRILEVLCFFAFSNFEWKFGLLFNRMCWDVSNVIVEQIMYLIWVFVRGEGTYALLYPCLYLRLVILKIL